MTEPPSPDPPSDGHLARDGTFQISRKDYTDGRSKGQFETRYPFLAWLQISIEALYLAAMIASSSVIVLLLAWRPHVVVATLEHTLGLISAADASAVTRSLQLWLTVFFSGVVGGATFAFKWLYHSVSWREWNRDRLVWRLSVPVLGGLIALFTGCMIMSGIIPLLSKELFSRLISCAGFGFFVGLFADNFLAALQKFAGRILGTLGKDA